MILSLSSIFKRQYDATYTRRLFTIPTPTFIYVIQGDGLLHINESVHILQRNQLFFLLPNMNIKVETHREPIHYYLLFTRCICPKHRKPSVTPETFAPLTPGAIPILPDYNGIMLDQIKTLYAAVRSRTTPPLEINAYFQEWLAQLLRYIRQNEQNASRISDGIKLSIEHMHQHFDRKLTLEHLAAIAGYTPTSYSREFKKIKGVSPIDYLNAHRIEHAKHLLLTRRYTIKEAASASGFSNEFYFSRLFKQKTGISPTLYIKRRNIRIASVSCLRFHDILMSLGVDPVYSANCHQAKTTNKDEHEENVSNHLSQIRQANPELIIGDSFHLPYLEQLKAIAPTHLLDFTMDWRKVYRQIGALVGREKEAERCIESTDKRVQESKPILHSRFGDASITLMRVVHKLIRIQGMKFHPLNELIYGELELKPGFCVPASSMNVEFSPDKYPDLDTDHLFIQKIFHFPEDEHVFRSLQKDSIWQNIRAVKKGQIHYIDNWFGMSWSSTGRMLIIEKLLSL
jgi:AraC family transcriptional regulator, transcriptional activator for feuABC-ybbA operon